MFFDPKHFYPIVPVAVKTLLSCCV